MTQHTLREMPDSVNPTVRMERLGPSMLSDAELLGIIIGAGTNVEAPVQVAENMLVQWQGLNGLVRADRSEFQNTAGVGPARAAILAAALELGRRIPQAASVEKERIFSPEDIARLLSDMGTLDREEMRVVVLNQKHRVMRIVTVYIGSVHTAVVRVGEIFAQAVRMNAAVIAVAHSHPSGDPTPSPEDAALTREIVKAGHLLDVDVLDHVVIAASGRFVSLKERGLGFDH